MVHRRVIRGRSLALFAVCEYGRSIVGSGGDSGNDVRLIDYRRVGGVACARQKIYLLKRKIRWKTVH